MDFSALRVKSCIWTLRDPIWQSKVRFLKRDQWNAMAISLFINVKKIKLRRFYWKSRCIHYKRFHVYGWFHTLLLLVRKFCMYSWILRAYIRLKTFILAELADFGEGWTYVHKFTIKSNKNALWEIRLKEIPLLTKSRNEIKYLWIFVTAKRRIVYYIYDNNLFVICVK